MLDSGYGDGGFFQSSLRSLFLTRDLSCRPRPRERKRWPPVHGGPHALHRCFAQMRRSGCRAAPPKRSWPSASLPSSATEPSVSVIPRARCRGHLTPFPCNRNADKNNWMHSRIRPRCGAIHLPIDEFLFPLQAVYSAVCARSTPPPGVPGKKDAAVNEHIALFTNGKPIPIGAGQQY